MMETQKKFNDCYFYYYSTCTKGDNCVFRHEPSALGCETMCTAWQHGRCIDKHCKLRHMELRKNRKQIPCYWETQPGGCRKMHCPFMHKNPDARTDGIAPSQPAPPATAQPVVSVAEAIPVEQPLGPVTGPCVGAAPVPMLWQQQRQVVLDSAILGVLPGPGELLARRLPPTHVHEAVPAPPPPAPYAPLPPVDPLVVNFEEESDNESAPSSTPTKNASPDEAQKIARSKSQELLLLEKIQAEAAAFYNYDALPPIELANERKIVRTNLSTKYDRLSLDEISGKKQCTAEKRKSLDFKVLSLDEIRARKKTTETIVHSTPITLTLSRKRKLSTRETVTTSGNKIIKVVRSNSIVYKKVDETPAPPNLSKVDVKQNESGSKNRKRTLSEQSDIYEIQEDELVDNCYEFKRIKIAEQTSKPRLIRNRQVSSSTSNETKDDVIFTSTNKVNNEVDEDLQIVSIDITDDHFNRVENESVCEIIDVESTKFGEPVDIVDLSEDPEEAEIMSDLDLVKNVPDVVASCQKHTIQIDSTDKDVLKNIDELINEGL